MNSFRLNNIKSFRDSGEVALKPITVLVGKNSCGKSTLLRFPALLAQTANFPEKNPPLSFFGDSLDFGNYEDVVFGKNKSDMISFSICYNIDISGNSRIIQDFGGIRLLVRSDDEEMLLKKTTITVFLRRVGKSVKVKQVSVNVDGCPLSNLEWNDGEGLYKLTLLAMYENKTLIPQCEHIYFLKNEVVFEKFFPVYDNNVILSIIRSFGYSIEPSRAEEIEKYNFLSSRGISSKVELSDDEQNVARVYKIFNFAAEVMTNIYKIFNAESKSRIAYIGPFRQNPSRIYRYSETTKIHVGTKGENIGDVLVGAYQKSDRNSIYSKVSEWLKEYFGYELIINDLGNNFFQIMLQDSNGIQSNIIDVGFGISQVLPIVSEICLTASQGKKRKIDFGINNILLIEQPELHLHPAAQASLADLFMMCVENNANSRLIIETHSEHLISKLQVLIADETNSLSNEMVQILYVDKNDKGEAIINEMKLKENGKFEKPWPTGFFDQGYNLSIELMKKSSSRDKGKVKHTYE